MLRSDAVISYASPAVRRLFGWQDDTIIGTSIIPLLHPQDRAALGRLLQGLLEEPGAHPAAELRLRHNGGWAWAEATLTNLLDDPVVRGVVCNLRLSGHRPAQDEATTKIAQLETALQSRLIIEQAKGYLAGRDRTTPEAAFERLRGYARTHHLAIRDVARGVVDGQLLTTA